MSNKLFLLDAYALIYRAYYAFIKNPRINSKGMNTSAIFGFVMTLDEVIKKEAPSHIGVVFDLSTPTFRKEIYPEYKAQRPPTPEDIRAAIPWIKDIIKAYNIPVLELERYEADDVIGTLAKKAARKGFTVYMYTPDKDYAQLVEEKIFMYKPSRSGNGAEILGIEEVKEKFGVESPIQVIDILGMQGDVSDNIPGAMGIGPKTAKKLIAKYGSCEGVIANVNDLTGKQKENIANAIDNIKISKELATICIDAPIELDDQGLVFTAPDYNKLSELFSELEFNTLIRKIAPSSQQPTTTIATPKPEGFQTSLFGEPAEETQQEYTFQSTYKTIADIDHNYKLVETQQEINALVAELSTKTNFCFDTETTGLDSIDSRIIGISFCFEKHSAYYVVIPTNKAEADEKLANFKPLFENPNIAKTGQNIKFDIQMLANHNIKVVGRLFDTMIAHYLINPEQKHNMDFLSKFYLNYEPISIESLIGKGKNQLSMATVAVEKIAEYGAEDADVTWQLKEILFKELEENNFIELYHKIEEPLIYVLTDMERTGITLNDTKLKSYTKELAQDIAKLETDIIEMSETPDLNVSSPKQLGIVLFEKLMLDPKAKLTKTKQYSTSEETLVKLKDKHPIIEKILEFRSLKKLLTTYIEPLPELINKSTGKIHTSYNQAVTSTGRLSSTNPNLQNIPIREERGKRVREAFEASEGCTLLSADYSQVELRVMAHISNDTNMIEAFNHEADIHTATAAKIFKKPSSEVTKEERSKAKTANFGIIYGISSFGLSQRLNISRTEAKQLIDGYFESFPRVKEFMTECVEIAREKGYVETLFNRKRVLADINSKNPIVRGVAERNAINAPIQGTAADIIKIAMGNIFNKLQKNNLTTKMVLQVHDELIFDVPNNELDKVIHIVTTEMEKAAKLSVNLTVDYGTGNNWLLAH